MKILIVVACTSKKKEINGRLWYTGMEHVTVTKAAEYLRKRHTVDLLTLSAKYGLIAEDKIIKEYNTTFNSMSEFDKFKFKKEGKRLSKKAKSYDYVFVILGKAYLEVLGMSLGKVSNFCFFVSASTEKCIPYGAKRIMVTPSDRSKYGAPFIFVKGKCFYTKVCKHKGLKKLIRKVWK